MTTPPVLFIVFKRPDSTRRVFEAIRRARPEKLFVAADGPRISRPGEAELCTEVRDIVSRIDWPCRLFTKLRTENAGIGVNVSEAITWMMNEAGEGIILEDDCLPSEDFFSFAEELLERYRLDARIMHISGSCFQPKTRGDDSYFFSKYNHGWGWASWKRAWDLFDFRLETLEDFLRQADSSDFWESKKTRKYWKKVFEETKNGKIDTWDYQWKLTLWREGGLAVYPNANMVSNLGFNAKGTNTLSFEKAKADRPHEILGTLKHPRSFIVNRAADLWTFKHMYWGTDFSRLSARLKKVGQTLGS